MTVLVSFNSVAPTESFYFALIYFYKVFRRKPHTIYGFFRSIVSGSLKVIRV